MQYHKLNTTALVAIITVIVILIVYAIFKRRSVSTRHSRTREISPSDSSLTHDPSDSETRSPLSRHKKYPITAVCSPCKIEAQFYRDGDGMAVSIYAIGGIKPYRFIWHDGREGYILRDIEPGQNLTLTAIDARGCKTKLKLKAPIFETIENSPLPIGSPEFPA
jgi:hypothetical protein